METIHIFHTNDWHSHFAYWPRTQAFITASRHAYEQRGDSVFVCDIGDHLDRSATFTEATLGKGNVALLNEAHYDVVTIGNNEGITLSFDDLCALYEDATFDIVVANLQNIEGETPSWVKPYVVKETKQGTKIAFIGATAPFEAFYRELNWDVSNPTQKLIQLAYYLRDKVDIIICLSHLGINEDEVLAEACPIIDVIFGSHTHHVLPTGKFVNGVLLTGGGMFGRYVGELTLSYDGTTVVKETKLHDSSQLPAAPNEVMHVAELEAYGEQGLRAPLFYTPRTYYKEWYHKSALSKLFATIMLEETGADVALFNAGIFLTDLEKGPTSALDLHRLLPHPINLCLVEVSGQQLKEIIAATTDERLDLKGLGFRGRVLGKMIYEGFSLDKERKLYVNGILAEDDTMYQLVTLDLFTFGYFFPQFKYAKKKYMLPQFLRELVIRYGQKYFK